MKAIVLAGGKGTRLWPLSRANYPKQFVKFIHEQSLFQLTILRLLAFFKSKDIAIVTSAHYRFHVLNQIEAIKGIASATRDSLKRNIILEPCPRSTAPAALLAMKYFTKTKRDEIFYVFPSDHIIQPLTKFKKALAKAKKLAERNRIVIFGLKPKKPETGYGYVLVQEKYKAGFTVKKFVEKPSPQKLTYIMKQRSFWNAGIFAFKKEIFLEELHKYSPRIYRFNNYTYNQLIKKFRSITADSIDYAIMQKTKKATLVPFGLAWSDLGSWESVLEFFSKRDGNFNIGVAQFLHSHGCFTFSKDRFIAALGLRDVVVVDDSDSVLVMKKGFSDNVKELTRQLKKRRISQISDSLTVYRPWGYYTILEEKKDYKVKEIGIYPKKFVSLQKHRYRSEHWNVVTGKALVTLKNKKTVIKKNQSVFVPKGIKHKVYNPTNEITKIIEVQIGSYLGEDDIVRYSLYEAK